jgi:hypothetical protein
VHQHPGAREPLDSAIAPTWSQCPGIASSNLMSENLKPSDSALVRIAGAESFTPVLVRMLPSRSEQVDREIVTFNS